MKNNFKGRKTLIGLLLSAIIITSLFTMSLQTNAE